MAFGGQSYNNGGLHRPQADINVTPLVDVMLVLLIVFMVTAPMLAQGLKVDLPQAKAAQPVNPKEPVVVTVARDGKVSIGQDEMDVSDLVAALLAKIDGDTTRVIQLRADKEANYGAIVAVIDQLATNGLVHIALISDPKVHSSTTPAAVVDGQPVSSTTAASLGAPQPNGPTAQ